jgi:hypothetical protein
MAGINRKQFLLGACAAGLGASFSSARSVLSSPFQQIRPDWIVSEQEALAWHKVKDQKGPALTGNESWHQFLQFLEGKLKEYGCVDVHRSSWMFDRMQTSYWPDDSGWSLTLNGRPVVVSNYGANCGLTGPRGITAETVLWDPKRPEDATGKIVIFRPTPREDVRDAFTNSDYEFLTAFDSYPIEGKPISQEQAATHSIAPVVWDEMTASSAIIQEIAAAKPAGLVFAMNLNRAATAGLYTFPVPEQYDFPSVYLDRTNGDAVIEGALGHATATIRVQGAHVQSEAYQLIACLPGRDYGRDQDQQVQLRTHTDGPSISQDDGAFGLLGVVKYMSKIPAGERPRSLLIELDCRHFMPGAERAWQSQDYFVKFPQARDKVVAMIAMEHLGQIDYVFDGEDIKPSGRSLPTWIYATTNQRVIDYAFQAARDNHLPSAIIRSPGRPGVHGKSQGPWYGMGGAARYLGLPAFGVQGDLGAYWAFSGRINRFDPRSFCRQVSTFCQLTGFWMTSDLSPLQAPKVERPAPGAGLPR